MYCEMMGVVDFFVYNDVFSPMQGTDITACCSELIMGKRTMYVCLSKINNTCRENVYTCIILQELCANLIEACVARY